MTLSELRHEYRPYDTLPAFDEGFASETSGNCANPYPDSYLAQAWDRGRECAARARRLSKRG